MIAGIILSAGESARMGDPKQFLTIKGKTFFDLTIFGLKANHIYPIITITNPVHQNRWTDIKKTYIDTIFIENPDPSRGQFSSLLIGLLELLRYNSDLSSAIISLIDHPLVSETVIKILIIQHNLKKDKIIIPCFNKRQGHPILIPAKYFNQIKEYEGTEGLKGFLNRNQHLIYRVDLDDDSILIDIDTPDEYIQLKNKQNKESII